MPESELWKVRWAFGASDLEGAGFKFQGLGPY